MSKPRESAVVGVLASVTDSVEEAAVEEAAVEDEDEAPALLLL